jgi:hypothetical protein
MAIKVDIFWVGVALITVGLGYAGEVLELFGKSTWFTASVLKSLVRRDTSVCRRI